MRIFRFLALINIFISTVIIYYISYIDKSCICIYQDWDITYIKHYNVLFLIINLVMLFIPGTVINSLVMYKSEGCTTKRICTDNCGYIIFLLLLLILQFTFIISIIHFYSRISKSKTCKCYNTWPLYIIFIYAILSVIFYGYLMLTLIVPWLYYVFLLVANREKAKLYYSNRNSFANLVRYKNGLNYLFKEKNLFSDINLKIIINKIPEIMKKSIGHQ